MNNLLDNLPVGEIPLELLQQLGLRQPEMVQHSTHSPGEWKAVHAMRKAKKRKDKQQKKDRKKHWRR